jgi:AcrR family transcriptional regulator
MFLAVPQTQQQRRTETRGKLLDATVRSLLDVGYAATTTRRVAELAGVSAGAMTHHFPHRVDLVAAAVERLTEQRVVALSAEAVHLPTDRKARARAALELLWRDFSSDLFAVIVKLWVAAADDPELYARLVPLEREVSRQIARALPVMWSGPPIHPPADIGLRVTTALATMRGLALSRAFEPTGRRQKDSWPAVRGLLEGLLTDS